MPSFFLKSYLSLVILLSALIAIFTALEMTGRLEQKFDREKLRKFHSANGLAFLFLCLVITYICFVFLVRTKAEPSARVMFHSLFSISVLLILCFKVLVKRIYRKFYSRLYTTGLVLVFVSFCMISTSAGYYLLITKFGSEIPAAGAIDQRKAAAPVPAVMTAAIDPETIAKGKALYDEKCIFCHDPLSKKSLSGPGHKGILKNPLLPVSGKPATPENIAAQLRTPYKDMPSFSYLTPAELQSLIAYMNTL